MRLIDADKLPVTGTVRIEDSKIKITGWISADRILEAPIVDAIPIDWISKWSYQFYKYIEGRCYYTGDGYDTVWDLLEAWEKENGKD